MTQILCYRCHFYFCYLTLPFILQVDMDSEGRLQRSLVDFNTFIPYIQVIKFIF